MRTAKSKILTLVAVAVVSSVVTLFLVLGTSTLGARPQQYTGYENHLITLDQAVKYIQNFKNSPSAPSIKGAYFGRSAFDKILAQSGCTGIRYYYAKKDDGTPTLVLVGIDGSGNDITGGGIYAEEAFPCPPYCGGPSPLNK
jgi:hypothetical protein